MIKKIIIYALYTIGIIYITSLYVKNKMDQVFLKEHKENVKYRSYYNTFTQWMHLIQNKRTIADYFKKEDTIAVYGMGRIGEFISCELLNNKRNVIFGIDKNSIGKNMETGLEVYSIEDSDDLEVDYIIVSISYLADEIIEILDKNKSVKIVTIDEILESLLLERR